MSIVDKWYYENWLLKETLEFNNWFESEYGSRSDFDDGDKETLDYYIRKSMSLMAWLERNKEVDRLNDIIDGLDV